jgi:hypothetical protein
MSKTISASGSTLTYLKLAIAGTADLGGTIYSELMVLAKCRQAFATHVSLE